ncbi:transposase [Idiomarina loihiensis]|uniref:hypothetical protein n=1 Tax=Idiomarina TaxID=135575 RepID=UPI000D713E77|nr:hypothetical protein [Idiomarina]PWW33358.1 transposase [Idiomarina loihiensis]TDP43696.1 transposase [Idiomarina loihiensis]TDS18448.1 transposase [Idiomarina sp. H2]
MPRRITSEFKRECADLALVHGYKHKGAVEAMGVDLSSIQRRVSQYKNEQQGVTPKAMALKSEKLRIQQFEQKLLKSAKHVFQV